MKGEETQCTSRDDDQVSPLPNTRKLLRLGRRTIIQYFSGQLYSRTIERDLPFESFDTENKRM